MTEQSTLRSLVLIFLLPDVFASVLQRKPGQRKWKSFAMPVRATDFFLPSIYVVPIVVGRP